MPLLEDFIQKEICDKNPKIEIIADSPSKCLSVFDEDFTVTYNDEVVEVFFLAKGNEYKFCHQGNTSEWHDSGGVNIKSWDKIVDLEKNKEHIIYVLEEAIGSHLER